jgi:hypothetical protein
MTSFGKSRDRSRSESIMHNSECCISCPSHNRVMIVRKSYKQCVYICALVSTHFVGDVRKSTAKSSHMDSYKRGGEAVKKMQHGL